ncbi:MAG: hypothetical protein FK731_05060 [Asgard group archaeon]|nr:hypothetical protein [Asgard group archaeon]
MYKRKKVIRKSLLIVLLFTCFFVGNPIEIKSTTEPFFTLTAKTGWFTYDFIILNFVKQHIARIGINLEPMYISVGWENELYNLHNYDLYYLRITGAEEDPDLSSVYCENASLNCSGYNTSMDWNEELGTGLNEWYLRQGTLIMPPDSEERIQHYWDWEQYLMDKLLLVQPTFIPVRFDIAWSNFQGYETGEGLKINWGKLSWDGSHLGQESTSEIIIVGSYEEILNPLYYPLPRVEYIPYYIFDGLVTFDSDLKIYPHLAYDWTFLNDTHLRLHLRQGIKWQLDPDGLFPDEYFDADDVVFSFYSWKHFSPPWVSPQFFWLEDVKKVDQYTVDFYIDGDPSTLENEAYAPLFRCLKREILPEHYLNQTQLADGKTPDITHSSWVKFSSHCFGTSLFELSSFIEVETNLKHFEDCWWLDPSIDKTGMDFDNRFGDFSGGINKLKIRYLSDNEQKNCLFELGKLDLIFIGSDFLLRDKYLEDPNYVIFDRIPFSLNILGYNLREEKSILGDQSPAPGNSSITKGLAIRKAISYAIDRNEINEVLFGGEFIINDYPIYARVGKWCNPDIIRYNHNLDTAREYMRIAGYPEEEIKPPRWTPLEITGIIFSSALIVGALSFISIRLYKKNKI